MNVCAGVCVYVHVSNVCMFAAVDGMGLIRDQDDHRRGRAGETA